jgi:hypothetical protein
MGIEMEGMNRDGRGLGLGRHVGGLVVWAEWEPSRDVSHAYRDDKER